MQTSVSEAVATGIFFRVRSRADDGSNPFTCKWTSQDVFPPNLFHLSSKWDRNRQLPLLRLISKNYLRQCGDYSLKVHFEEDDTRTQTTVLQRPFYLSQLRWEKLKAWQWLHNLSDVTSGFIGAEFIFFLLNSQSGLYLLALIKAGLKVVTPQKKHFK